MTGALLPRTSPEVGTHGRLNQGQGPAEDPVLGSHGHRVQVLEDSLLVTSHELLSIGIVSGPEFDSEARTEESKAMLIVLTRRPAGSTADLW